MMDATEIEWRRSSLCTSASCVAVAITDKLVAMRDTKEDLGSILKFDRVEWSEFLAGAVQGEFDLLT